MTLPGQMELATVIDHREVFERNTRCYVEDTHKHAGVRLAKMLGQYEARPSSELWSGIQSLAREILKA